MGLDMYAYTATKPDADYETEQREIAYWRKHPNLHGWMEQLWCSRNPDADEYRFNGIEHQNRCDCKNGHHWFLLR